jgi:acetyl-CoA acetyltransferase
MQRQEPPGTTRSAGQRHIRRLTLEQSGEAAALASMCNGGRQGVATILERM